MKKTKLISAVVAGLAVAAGAAITYVAKKQFEKALDDIDWLGQ